MARRPRALLALLRRSFAALREKAPNRAHAALVELERRGLLDAVITQNIDTLHRRAGSRAVVEMHGTIEWSLCLRDGARFDLAEVLARIDGADDGVPRCDDGHPLKPAVTLFGELLDEGAVEQALQLCLQADVLLCVGSSLEVSPVAELPGVVHAGGGTLAVITARPTPWDRRAAFRLGGDVVEELEVLLTALGGLAAAGLIRACSTLAPAQYDRGAPVRAPLDHYWVSTCFSLRTRTAR